MKLVFRVLFFFMVYVFSSLSNAVRFRALCSCCVAQRWCCIQRYFSRSGITLLRPSSRLSNDPWTFWLGHEFEVVFTLVHLVSVIAWILSAIHFYMKYPLFTAFAILTEMTVPLRDPVGFHLGIFLSPILPYRKTVKAVYRVHDCSWFCFLRLCMSPVRRILVVVSRTVSKNSCSTSHRVP